MLVIGVVLVLAPLALLEQHVLLEPTVPRPELLLPQIAQTVLLVVGVLQKLAQHHQVFALLGLFVALELLRQATLLRRRQLQRVFAHLTTIVRLELENHPTVVMASGVLGHEASKQSQTAVLVRQVSIAKPKLLNNQLGCAARATTVLLVAHLLLQQRLLAHLVASAQLALQQQHFVQRAPISQRAPKVYAFLVLQATFVHNK